MAHIMVVDDDRDIVALIKHVLQKAGHQVTETFHGADALEKLGVEPENGASVLPDLIVLDLMMPKMDGYSVTVKLAANPRTRTIPIVVLTVKDKMRDQFEMAPNVAAFVGKPFDVKNLAEMVSKILSSGK